MRRFRSSRNSRNPEVASARALPPFGIPDRDARLRRIRLKTTFHPGCNPPGRAELLTMKRLLLILLLACGGRTAACAQVAVADSLVTDSLVNDSLTMLQDRQLEILEAPIDTARLYAGSDSIHQTTTPEPVKKRWMPDPKRATWLALLIPGGGQIYNRKYWKLPIVYGGFVGCAYALTWNNQMYSDYSQAYLDLMDDDPNTDSYKDFLPPNYKIEGNESQFENIFKRKKDYYRRYRDLSIFCFIAVYALSVIDAYVDAELSNFDISKDISLKVEPTIINNNNNLFSKNYSRQLSIDKNSSVGLQCRLRF